MRGKAIQEDEEEEGLERNIWNTYLTIVVGHHNIENPRQMTRIAGDSTKTNE